MSKRVESDEDDLFGDSGSEPKEQLELGKELFGESDDEIKEEKEGMMSENEDKELFGESDEELQKEVLIDQPEHIVETSLPPISGPLGNHDLFLLKLPSILKIDYSPFDAEKFQETTKDQLQALANTLRWRNTSENPESNARLVRWEDDSFSLMVGDEIFDVKTTDITNRFQFLASMHSKAEVVKTHAR
jgi:hypothetical protein